MNRRAIEVSVIMAAHNSSAYLDEAVSSILNQTCGGLELILIDDCSADNTLEIANRYRMQDNRVSVLSLSKNCGPAIARNTGIRAARAEWLGILDSDDVAMPSRFEEQIKLADSEESLVMIASDAISIDAKGNTIKQHRYPTRHSDLVKRLVAMRAFPTHSSLMYRRDVVTRVSAFNPRFVQSEDYDLWLRLSEIGKVASVDKPLVKIRRHEQNISHSQAGLVQARMGFAAAVCHFLRKHGYPDPSTSNDERSWQEFLDWVEMRMTERGVFEKQRARADARAKYYSAENRLLGAFRSGSRLLQSGQASVLVWNEFFGSLLPHRLAWEWMKRACVAS